MPITDLLNQISGGKSHGSPAPAVQRLNAAPIKRKADDDLLTATAKAPRLFTSSSSSQQRPRNGLSGQTISVPSRPISKGAQTVKSSVTSRVSAPPTDSKPKGAPKKGSYAEILARAQRAQAVMGQVGKIQHKKVEKGAMKKDTERVAVKTGPSGSQGRKPTGYAGTSKTGQKPGSYGHTASRPDRPGTAIRIKAGPGARKAPAPEPEKKIKKAASATTGYTGTARPRPGDSSKKGSTPRGGALLNAPTSRSGSSRRGRYEDDFDEEMDDFIDYDDEEDDGEPRYDYASDASSDMEAGLGDIDDEERTAERIARKEDLEEQRLEKSLKVAKEERKRKALEELRSKRR